MNASKEMAQLALERFRYISGGIYKEDYADFIEEFLVAATKRLPTEAAIKKDKERRKSVKKS